MGGFGAVGSGRGLSDGPVAGAVVDTRGMGDEMDKFHWGPRNPGAENPIGVVVVDIHYHGTITTLSRFVGTKKEDGLHYRVFVKTDGSYVNANANPALVGME